MLHVLVSLSIPWIILKYIKLYLKMYMLIREKEISIEIGAMNLKMLYR